MHSEREFLLKRLTELSDKSDARGIYTYTGFLTEGEQAEALAAKKQFRAPITLFGGAEGCERKMARFGSAESCGYEEPFPVICVRIQARGAKFSGVPEHRDFLGAVMHLGVERETVGDIMIEDETAYVFCTETAAAAMERELTAVRRTAVHTERCELPAELLRPETHEETVQLSGERTDAMIAKVFRLSREKAQELFPDGRVFLNGIACEKPDAALHEGDMISVRGFGRFRYLGVERLTKKGKKNVRIEKFGK